MAFMGVDEKKLAAAFYAKIRELLDGRPVEDVLAAALSQAATGKPFRLSGQIGPVAIDLTLSASE
jgi:hypothetical protein